MILAVAKIVVKPELADRWPELSREYTEASRAVAGTQFFSWSRSVDDPNEYVLVAGFDAGSVVEMLGADHFVKARALAGNVLSQRPVVFARTVDDGSWDELSEFDMTAAGDEHSASAEQS